VIRFVRERPHTFIAIADAIVAALLVAALAAEIVGDFETRILGVRISVKSVWRIVLFAAIVAAIRHALVPRPPLLNRLWGRAGAVSAPLFPPLSGAPGRRRWLMAAGLFVFFLAATAAVLPTQFAHPHHIPDHGDPLFSIWRLAWFAHQLPRNPVDLFDANIFHPQPRTLAYSDAMLVPGLAAAPLIWLGVHQVLAYTIVFLLAIVLSGVCAFVLVRALTGSDGAALIAGLLLAFCAFRFSHYSHLELQVTHWMPLALYFLHRTIEGHRLRDGVLTGVIIALQTLSSLYYGLFFIIFVAAVFAALWIAGRIDVRAVVRPLAAGACVAALLVLPLTTPYWLNRGDVGERNRDEIEAYSAKAADYLAPHGRSVYRGYGTQAPGERELFPGLVPIALLVVALWPPLTPVRFAYAAGLVLAVDASLGLNGEAYHWIIDYLPGARGFRAPARFGVIVALALSVLGGLAAARLLRRVEAPRGRAALVAACALAILIEARPRLTLEPIWLYPPRVYEALPRDRTTVLAEFPFPQQEGAFWHDGRYMYFSTFHWHRLVNGNSGFFPRSYYALVDDLLRFPSDEGMAALRARGVEYLVVHGGFEHAPEHARLTAALEQRPDVALVTADRWIEGEVRLYRLQQ
jgi:hypothetical protein